MELEGYGILLKSLTEKNLEQVRIWRNSYAVKSQMIYKENISTEAQKAWFSNLDNHSLYLLITYQNENIGLINLKEIDWQKRRAEAGIFIGEEEHRNGYIGIMAIFVFMDFVFEFSRFNSLKAKVLKSNKRALEMNMQLGYQKVAEEEEYWELEILPEAYFKSKDLILHNANGFGMGELDFRLTKAEKELFSSN